METKSLKLTKNNLKNMQKIYHFFTEKQNIKVC